MTEILNPIDLEKIVKSKIENEVFPRIAIGIKNVSQSYIDNWYNRKGSDDTGEYYVRSYQFKTKLQLNINSREINIGFDASTFETNSYDNDEEERRKFPSYENFKRKNVASYVLELLDYYGTKRYKPSLYTENTLNWIENGTKSPKSIGGKSFNTLVRQSLKESGFKME